MSRKLFKLLFLFSFLCPLSTTTFAQDTPENNQDEPIIIPDGTDVWQFELAPLYIWFAGIGGTSSLDPVTAPLEVSFGEVLDNLDTVLTLLLRRERKNGV